MEGLYYTVLQRIMPHLFLEVSFLLYRLRFFGELGLLRPLERGLRHTVYSIQYAVDVIQALTERRTHTNVLMNTHADGPIQVDVKT